MRYEIVWRQAAVEALMLLGFQQPRLPQRILMTTRAFGRDGSGDVKKLEGSEDWRLRVGDWRVIFTKIANSITVIAVTNRRDAY